ncbi:hemerythrin [Streptomyces sp. NRRL F-4489]|uniref:hemerythrin domain-containing protein n=1 Tax=Streptomyces sp. NRRL F-4489 TaxID=1609095 RepID=UPI000748EAA0|nr:hemerythrin domain-containing protein [Streptomyces sp. NRRL F-4489]KUL36883.1 hemerythrin [Streptomyces sp. NRRL F-4489]
MGHGGNVIAELTADHDEVNKLFDELMAQPVGSKRRRELADRITVELVRHSVAEEQYLYPAVREHVEGGRTLADKEIRDHAEVERLLKALESLEPTDDRFDQQIATLKTSVQAHVQDEENRLFPQLADACSPAVLAELGDKIRRAKKLAPTRPHPSAPDTPPANKLLAPGVGLVDRVRDYVSGRRHHIA